MKDYPLPALRSINGNDVQFLMRGSDRTCGGRDVGNGADEDWRGRWIIHFAQAREVVGNVTCGGGVIANACKIILIGQSPCYAKLLIAIYLAGGEWVGNCICIYTISFFSDFFLGVKIYDLIANCSSRWLLCVL
jgi:hypothetical protein